MTRCARFTAAILMLAAAAASHAQGTNSCLDAAWSFSLRCQDAADPLALVPQPPVQPPLTPQEIREFTRIDLDDSAERCLDGTVPILWVDPAVGGPSDDWLITVTGGGSCSAEPDPITGNLTAGQTCLDAYVSGELSEMSSAPHPATKNLGNDAARSSTGIYSPDPVANPVFSRFNRVRIQKCSYDRYNGASTRRVEATHPTNGTIEFDLIQEGQGIVRSALMRLFDGESFDQFIDVGGLVETVEVTLPPLEQAERVLFVGHSGGAHGLMHGIDRIREALDRGAFDGDVRIVLDANLVPSLENEAAFDTAGPTGDLYDHIASGLSDDAAPLTGAYGPDYYSDPMAIYPRTYEAWSSVDDPTVDIFDVSCVQAHPGEELRCADRFHVLFNHITTPLFVRQDLTDSNPEHIWNGVAHVMQWGEVGSYAHCPLLPGGGPCPPAIAPADHRARLLEQQQAFASGLHSRSELVSSFSNPGTGAAEDPSGTGLAPSLYLFLPDCASHAGAYDGPAFAQTLLDRPGESTTMRGLLETFVLEAPPVGAVEQWVDGVDGVTSACPPQSASGRVPDGRLPIGTPLTITKRAGGEVGLDWGISCLPSDTDFAVYEGTLGDFSSHRWLTCGTGGVTRWSGVPSSGSAYYLVAPQSATGEGSYGRDSHLHERGQGLHACRPQAIAACN